MQAEADRDLSVLGLEVHLEALVLDLVDLEVTARIVEKPRTSPTTVCSVEL